MTLAASPDPLYLAFQLALVGRYSIVRELGRGGMGVVYLAHEVHLDRLVAIKLLPPEQARHRERFQREARLAAKLSHPHIVAIHTVDEVEEFVFYVMAYVDGETLAWALGHAHSHGVVHRDVKPDNILIEAASGRALVTDFGIAAIGDNDGDQRVTGTPEFMSPEQALGGDIDARSDIYGLGATAFYAFSGRVPFEGRTATEILARQVTEAPPPLASLGLAVPRSLASLVDRCLAKEPARRPASAEAIAEQLGARNDQRRALPPALRAFVRHSGRMDGAGSVLYVTGLLAASIGASAVIGVHAGFTTFVAGAVLGPVSFAIAAARRLLRLGFGRPDLGPAFRAELETSREERAVEHLGSRALERAVALVARVSGSFSGMAIPVLIAASAFRGTRPFALAASTAVAVTAAVAVTSGLGYLAMVQQRRDVDAEFWGKLWMGRIGAVVFAAARKLNRKHTVVAPMTHRATELSLGMAAEDLYDSLPKDTRRALGDVPALLRRLQQDAQSLRTRFDALDEAVAGEPFSDAAEAVSILRDERDAVREKLSEAVAALETIRLNLLRLHAGSVTVEGFTTHLGLAEEMSAELARLVAAHDAVESALRFPRTIEHTPA
jgi:serine/threonine-protein kinase